MEKMNRPRRNWMAFLEKNNGHKSLGQMGSLTEKKLLHEIEQNSDAAAAVIPASSVVAVCVEKNSELTVIWALNNLVSEGDQLMLIHVRRPVVAVPTPLGNMPIAQVRNDFVVAYEEKVASQTLNLLQPLQQMCNSKKVRVEIIVLADHNIPNAILKHIWNSRISKLVIGCSHSLITRKLKCQDMPTSIAMKASKFCSVYVISKGKLASVHPSNTSAQDGSSCSSEDTLVSVHPSNKSAQDGSNCSSEDTLVSREMTGGGVLEPSETTTNVENGNQSFENNRRVFEETFVSKPDIETKLERLQIELQHTRETCREAVNAFEGTIPVKYKTEGVYAQLIEEFWKLEETRDAFESAYRCRGYSFEQIEFATDFFSERLKIGEGGYGPVYKGSLDHTSVAIKVLRTDATQGRHEFQREVEVLSRIHHPNMVLLLGACPERGCLIYEYMENGSLQDQLFHSGARASLPWFVRFRIASEIASALNFLHTAKPEPIVHRDLKPDNILLDHNFVSKISDVGLARLIPPTVSCTVTEYKNTVLAGTFYYIDPEYVRTGTLRPTSDLYALGIILLQLLTAEPPMGIIERVKTAIEKGPFNEILDKTAGEWPREETEEFAKLALKCTELRRKDRPDLGTDVLPELERFRDLSFCKYQTHIPQLYPSL